MTTNQHLLAWQARVKAARTGDSRHRTIELVLREAAQKDAARRQIRAANVGAAATTRKKALT